MRRPMPDAVASDVSEPSRSTSKQARVDEEEEPPGVIEDSDSDDDRPSRGVEAPSRRPPPADDVPDLIDDWLEPARSAPVEVRKSATPSQDAPRVRRPPLDLPPGVSPQAAYAWACGHTGAPPCDTSSAPVSPKQVPADREDTGRADDIKRRSQASRGDGMETFSAAVPLTTLEPGVEPHAALLWATRIATEAEKS